MSAVAEEKILSMGRPNGGPYPVLGRLEQPRSASVRVPLCLDLATIDSTELFSGTPGGGGIGLAVDMHIFLKVVPADEWQVEVMPDLSVEHVCRSICRLVGQDKAFRITTPEEAGVPFDASAEIVAAAAAAVNASLGRPFGQRELRRIISNNLVEETSGELVLAPDNGVRVAGSFFGGLVIVTDELEIACRTPLPDQGSIVLAFPKQEGSPLDRAKMVQIDEKDREKKALEVLMKLMPAAIKSEIPKMGDSIYRLQLLGSKVVEIRRFGGGKDIYRLMSMLRVKGCEIVAVHNDTGIVTIYVNQGVLDDALQVIRDAGMEKIITRPDNKGMRITLTK
jgi:predicted sugar kinase